MVPLLHIVVILTNSSTTALLKDSKSYLMLPGKFQMTKPEYFTATFLIHKKPDNQLCLSGFSDICVIVRNGILTKAGISKQLTMI